MLTISNEDFSRLVTFMKSSYGIDLTKKRQLITGRLSNTILEKGFSSFTEYVDYILKSRDPKEIDILINKLTTNYTYFMRESTHFDFLKDTILPWLEKVKKNRVLSIWSAGCSSGEEPYTISMILRDYFGSKTPKWDTRILATDISQNVLSTAQNASYDLSSLNDLPAGWLQKYFQKEKDGSYRVTQEIQSNVIFKTFNLMDPIKFRLKFDVIFCRNVMIYFDQPTKEALVNRFYNATVPDGYLMIGHSESLNKETTPYRYIMPATYRKIV